jgi:hypothetical protein
VIYSEQGHIKDSPLSLGLRQDDPISMHNATRRGMDTLCVFLVFELRLIALEFQRGKNNVFI